MISLSDDVIISTSINRSYRWRLLRFFLDQSFQAVLDYLRCNNIRQQRWVTQDSQLARHKCEKSLGFRHFSFDQMRTDGLLWLLYVDKIYICKGSSDPSHFIFEINVGKRLIRHATTLKLNDKVLKRLKIDWNWPHSNSESFYVESASFRLWFQKMKWFGSGLPSSSGIQQFYIQVFMIVI